MLKEVEDGSIHDSPLIMLWSFYFWVGIHVILVAWGVIDAWGYGLQVNYILWRIKNLKEVECDSLNKKLQVNTPKEKSTSNKG